MIPIEDYINIKKSIYPKIALVSPSQKREIESNIPPFGLISIKSYLSNYVNIRIFDSAVYESDRTMIADLDAFLKDGGILGVQSYTRTYSDVAKEILGRFSNKKVLKVLGGHYITALPRFDHAHICIRGFGEICMFKIINALKKNHVNWWINLKNETGICFYSNRYGLINGGIFNSSFKTRFLEFDYMFDIIDYTKYEVAPAYKHPENEKTFYIITSRGCTKNCSFCSTKIINKRCYHFKDLNIIRLIENISLRGYNYVQFWDDDFLSKDVNSISKISNLLRKRKMVFSCFARADSITEEKVLLLSRNNCYRMFIGIESGNQNILSNTYNKNESIEAIVESVRLLHFYNIKFICGLIVGAPEETDLTIQQSLNLAMKLNPFVLWIEPLSVDPGTKIFQELTKKKAFPFPYIPDPKYGLNEPRNIPVVSNLSNVKENQSFTSLRIEKEILHKYIRDCYKAFYLQQKHHKKYFILGNSSEREYLLSIYSELGIYN